MICCQDAKSAKYAKLLFIYESRQSLEVFASSILGAGRDLTHHFGEFSRAD